MGRRPSACPPRIPRLGPPVSKAKRLQALQRRGFVHRPWGNLRELQPMRRRKSLDRYRRVRAPRARRSVASERRGRAESMPAAPAPSSIDRRTAPAYSSACLTQLRAAALACRYICVSHDWLTIPEWDRLDPFPSKKAAPFGTAFLALRCCLGSGCAVDVNQPVFCKLRLGSGDLVERSSCTGFVALASKRHSKVKVDAVGVRP